MSENVADDQEVVGEPVSQPHHAAVVGEPPEEITPVLGEPVPLANGAQKDQQPVSSPAADDSSINGVLQDTTPASELSSLESPSPSGAGEQSSLEVVCAEDQPAAENPIPPEPTTEASDVSTVDTHEAKLDEEIPADVEISHITDVATGPPPSESESASTENPYSALDQYSQESSEATIKEESALADRLLDDAPSISKKDEASSGSGPPGQVKDGLGAPTADTPAMVTTSVTVMQDDPEKDLASASQEKVTPSPEGIKEPELDEPEQFSPDVSTQDSTAAMASLKQTSLGFPSLEEGKVHEDKVEEKSATSGLTSNAAEQRVSKEVDKIEEDSAKSGNASNDLEQVVSEDGVLPEVGSNEDIASGKPEAPGKAPTDEVEQVVIREDASQPEVFSNKEVSGKEGGDLAASDSSQAPCDNLISSEASSAPPSGTRDFPLEERSGGQLLNETAFGENGFPHGQDGAPLDREQGETKGDSGNAEGKEKPTLRSKAPFIFTTVAIAIVGVAFATLSRSRQ